MNILIVYIILSLLCDLSIILEFALNKHFRMFLESLCENKIKLYLGFVYGGFIPVINVCVLIFDIVDVVMYHVSATYRKNFWIDKIGAKDEI